MLSGAAAYPLAAAAQHPERIRRIGVVMPWSENDPFAQRSVTAVAQALERLGWVEGKNIRIDYRFAAGAPALYKSFAAELVGQIPDAILAGPGTAVAALRERTHTIPIVFVLTPDPVGQGFVQSLARPGGNITGFSSFDAPMMGKMASIAQGGRPRGHAGRRHFQPGELALPPFA